MIVLDGSAAVDMVRETSEGLALAQLLLDGEKIISHDLFSTEVCNAFWAYHQVSKLDRNEVAEYVAQATRLVDEFYRTEDLLREALMEAMRLDHPVYGMLYFVLARREGATLFTLDQKLQGLCADNGVDCGFLDTEV